jgi:Nuclease A inhibitor-like protein
VRKPALLLTLACILSACGSATLQPASVAGAPFADDLDEGDTLATQDFALSPAQVSALGLSAQGVAQPLTVSLSIQAGTITRTFGQRKATAKLTYGPSGTVVGTLALSLEAAGAVLNSQNSMVKMTAPSPKGLDLISTTRSTKYGATTAATCAKLTYALKVEGGDAFNSAAPLSVCETANDARAALVAATEGLFYLSESDSLWTPAQLTTTPQPLPAPGQAFGALVGLTGPSVEVEAVDFDAFFAKVTTPIKGDAVQNEAAKRYAALRKVFKRNYSGLEVYRIRDTELNRSSWQVYVVGVNAFGISGIWATSIET